jgi:hypothetical protein
MATRKSSSTAQPRTRKSTGTGSADSAPVTPPPGAPGNPRITANPVFAEPGYMQDPTQYRSPHASDSNAYKELDQLTKLHQFNPVPFRTVQGVTEPVLTLAAYGPPGQKSSRQSRKPARSCFTQRGIPAPRQ